MELVGPEIQQIAKKNGAAYVIIVYRSIGNHCNQLFQYAHYSAFCRKHGVRFVPLFIGPLTSDFQRLGTEHGLANARLWYPLLSYAVKFLVKLGALKPWGFDSPEAVRGFLNDFSPAKTYLVSGWEFKFDDLLEEYRDTFKELFELNGAAHSSPTNSKTLGIHIRRGDYRFFEGGKYYFSDETYKNIILRAQKVFKGKIERVVVFTNDPDIDRGAYTQIQNVEFSATSSKPYVHDLEAMSRCGWLIGPPSTFTMWASYVGKVPLYLARGPLAAFGEDDFKIYPFRSGE